MGIEKLKEIKVVNRAQIKHHSYVDIMGLLKSIPTWFNQMGYFFYEKGLAEKDIGTGDQIETEWIAVKEVTEYVKYEFELIVIAKDIRKVVLENGEEIYWGRTLIIITATIKKDYQNKYNGPWGEFIRQFYERYIVGDELKRFMGKLVGEAGDLTNVLKSSLK